jgi:elongation factor G
MDPFVGKLGLFRVHQGTIRAGAQLFVGDGRKPVKMAHIFRMQGKDHSEVPQAVPGDICAVAKLDELHFDAVLHDSHDEDNFHLKSMAYPPAMLGVAIEPERRGDEHKLAEALHKLAAEDPCVRVEHHGALNETVLYGMGDLHLRVMTERMSERYGVSVKTRPPSIPYRETITRAAEGHHRHKKQTGGAGQFGEVYLRIEPLARGSGFEFVDDVVGGSIPNQFIPAVEKGIRHALAEGRGRGVPAPGHPRLGLRRQSTTRSIRRKSPSYRRAARRSWTPCRRPGPAVLEPIVHVEINAPGTVMGDITADLATRRARIDGNEARSRGRIVVSAYVPLAEVTDYQNRLKALTGARAASRSSFRTTTRCRRASSRSWHPPGARRGRGRMNAPPRADTRIMAVFCDFENVALGVRDAKIAAFDIRKVLERLLLKGNIVVKKAYCNWDRYHDFKRGMHEAAFEMIEIPHVRQSGKNSADIRWSLTPSTFATRRSTSTPS